MDLVSIVIPCYNGSAYLFEAIASARNQTYKNIEIILVNDGSDQLLSQEIVNRASLQADLYLSQENLGPSAARNAGIRAARGGFIVPLDSDDILQPDYIATALAALHNSPGASFAYTAYEVFGKQNYPEQPGQYNLYRLLDLNFLAYCALIRKEAWAHAGGYDETMRHGYEDWEFWLHLGALKHFGAFIPQILFRYRKHGPSLLDVGRRHHTENVDYIHQKHADLYGYEGRARVKARWQPSVAVISSRGLAAQTILDIEIRDSENASRKTLAPAILMCGPGPLDSHSAETAALAVWTGHKKLRLRDGSVALCSDRPDIFDDKNPGSLNTVTPSSTLPVAPTWFGNSTLRRHLENAGLLSISAWLRHPWQSALRLIPLRIKERINEASGRQIFDLTFYLQFQPNSIIVENTILEPLCYFPRKSCGRSRIALITPHLGPGGAESVLLDIAAGLDRTRFEVLLIATQSKDNRWLSRWEKSVDHVYDIAALAYSDRVCAAILTIVTNWDCDTIVVQNSLPGYTALAHIKRERAGIKAVDIVHSLDDQWDQISAIAGVAPEIDLRIAACRAVERRLLESGVGAAGIRLIPNGVDLQRFQSQPLRVKPQPFRILFAGRLDPVKRPLLLVRIAKELASLRGLDFQFVIAGDGPEAKPLQQRARQAGVRSVFSFLGHVENSAPLFASCDLVILTSRAEGVPLVVLEALASARPVVASNVGAVSEILNANCGVLVDVGRDEVRIFAQALNALLNQPGRRQTMGAEGRRRILTEYDLERTRQAYCDVFATTVAGTGLADGATPQAINSPQP